MTDPRILFRSQLKADARLCLLPLSRVKVEEPVHLAQDLVLFPRGTLEPHSLRIVAFPAHEWREAARRGSAHGHGVIRATGSELAWLKSAATGLEIEAFFDSDLLAMPLRLEWDRFLAPESHEAHLDMIALAQGHAEAVLDMIRFDYCRVDVPQTLPGRAGFLPQQGFTAALFYSLEDHESYIVAGEIVTHQIVAGLGLELDNVSPMAPLGDGEVGYIARHGLRMHTMAIEAADDTAKFVQLMTLLDYLAEPNTFIGMQDAKKRIGRHVAKDRAEYDAIMEDFKFLTSEGGAAPAHNRGLRHNIVHLGKRLEDLLSRPDRQTVLRRVNRYAGVTLKDMIERSNESWAGISAHRRERGITLGLEGPEC